MKDWSAVCYMREGDIKKKPKEKEGVGNWIWGRINRKDSSVAKEVKKEPTKKEEIEVKTIFGRAMVKKVEKGIIHVEFLDWKGKGYLNPSSITPLKDSPSFRAFFSPFSISKENFRLISSPPNIYEKVRGIFERKKDEAKKEEILYVSTPYGEGKVQANASTGASIRVEFVHWGAVGYLNRDSIKFKSSEENLSSAIARTETAKEDNVGSKILRMLTKGSGSM